MFLLVQTPVSTSTGAAVPLHTSLSVWPVVAPKSISMPLSSVCAAPVIATAVASVVEKLSFDQENVSGVPVPSILT